MKKIFLTVLMAGISVFGIAQSKMSVELPDINTVEVSGNIILKVISGDTNELRGDVDYEINNYLKWQLTDNATLSIKLTKPLLKNNSEDNVILYLTQKGLKSIAAKEGATVLSEDTLDFSSLRLSADGHSTISMDIEAKVVFATANNKSKIVLHGESDFIVLNARYNSIINAENLEVDIANVDTFVSSECLINAREIVVTQSNMNGTIKYRKGAEVVVPLTSNKKNIVEY